VLLGFLFDHATNGAPLKVDLVRRRVREAVFDVEGGSVHHS